MEVSFIGGLIGNSCFLQKESLDGSTSQVMESREGEKEKRFQQNLFTESKRGCVVLRPIDCECFAVHLQFCSYFIHNSKLHLYFSIALF